MNPQRLDALADGIFAIVMTILVFDLTVPALSGQVSNAQLWEAVLHQMPQLIAFTLSFAVLFTYWRAHHYLMGIYAKTLDIHLTNINAVFFFFVAIIPFSANLLGTYSASQVAIALFSANIVCIGLSLLWMRSYVLFSKNIKRAAVGQRELRHGMIRSLGPIIFSILAVGASFWSVRGAVVLLILAISFNLFRETTHIVDRLFGIDPEK